MVAESKKNKNPDYIGIPINDNKLNIQKSNPMQTLSETELSLAEFKILDAYLSRIDSHKPEKRIVRFEKGELERMLGVDRIRQAALEQRLKNLFQVVTIKDESKPKGFKLISLFEQAEAVQDDDGLWQVNLECSRNAMEYIFNIDTMGYLPYMLKNIIELKSRYSYILYIYLENNRFRKSWEISLSELREKLNCTADSYNEYKWFNSKILKKCWQELNKKTSIRYSYEPCQRKGRKYTAIRFTLETQSDLEYDENQLTLDDINEQSEDDKASAYSSDTLSFLAQACNYEFTDTQMKEIFAIISTMDIPKHMDSIDLGRYQYLSKMYAALNSEAERKAQMGDEIKNRFKYFKGMLRKDKGK